MSPHTCLFTTPLKLFTKSGNERLKVSLYHRSQQQGFKNASKPYYVVANDEKVVVIYKLFEIH